MASLSRNHPFALTDEEIARIGAAFRKAGFDEAGVTSTLGVKGIPAIKDMPAKEAFRRTSSDSHLHMLIRLFMIGVAGKPEAVAQALGIPSPDRLIAGDLLEEKNGKLFGAIKITPIDGMLIAFDRTWEDETVSHSDHVMGPSDSARFLSGQAIHRPCENALDLGTGNGYLAFKFAKHSKRVVATDVNPRSAAFVALNAKLNGITNVEARIGDLCKPVEGELFDFILSNPPFVISPEDRLVYLSGGMKSDAFCRRIAREVPAVMREGGYFQMLCNWVEYADRPWQDTLGEWFQGNGCDTWVLRSSTTDPVNYANNWMNAGHNESAATNPERLEAWLEYYQEEKIGSIGAGVVNMRKRRAGSASARASASGASPSSSAPHGNWFRTFDGPEKIAGPCGESVANRMDALDILAREAENEARLMGMVFQVSSKIRLTQECTPSEGGWALNKAFVQVTEGYAYKEEIDTYCGELLVSCNGKRTLQEAIAATAATLGMATEDIPTETGDIIRQFVDEGFLIPVPGGKV